MPWMAYLPIAAMAIGLIVAMIARTKGRAMFPWWIYGTLAAPAALPHVLLARPLDPFASRGTGRYGMPSGRRPCPHCAAPLFEETVVCPGCGGFALNTGFGDIRSDSTPYGTRPAGGTSREHAGANSADAAFRDWLDACAFSRPDRDDGQRRSNATPGPGERDAAAVDWTVDTFGRVDITGRDDRAGRATSSYSANRSTVGTGDAGAAAGPNGAAVTDQAIDAKDATAARGLEMPDRTAASEPHRRPAQAPAGRVPPLIADGPPVRSSPGERERSPLFAAAVATVMIAAGLFTWFRFPDLQSGIADQLAGPASPTGAPPREIGAMSDDTTRTNFPPMPVTPDPDRADTSVTAAPGDSSPPRARSVPPVPPAGLPTAGGFADDADATAPPAPPQAAAKPPHAADAGDSAEDARPQSRRMVAAPRISAEGLLVRRIQRALLERGYRPGEPDGLAGPQTQRAIKAFQHDSGRRPTGEIDRRLLADLGL